MDNLAISCGFNNAWHACNELMHYIWTDEGLCFNFNILNGTDLFTDSYVLIYTIHFRLPHQILIDIIHLIVKEYTMNFLM